MDLLKFTDAELWVQQMKEQGQEITSQAKTTMPCDSLKIPGKFSGKHQDWMKFQKAFIAYLESMMNPYDVPLTYIIRSDEEGVDMFEADNAYAYKIQHTPHRGDAYGCDSYQIYQLLSGLMMMGTGRTQIEDHQDDG